MYVLTSICETGKAYIFSSEGISPQGLCRTWLRWGPLQPPSLPITLMNFLWFPVIGALWAGHTCERRHRPGMLMAFFRHTGRHDDIVASWLGRGTIYPHVLSMLDSWRIGGRCSAHVHRTDKRSAYIIRTGWTLEQTDIKVSPLRLSLQDPTWHGGCPWVWMTASLSALARTKGQLLFGLVSTLQRRREIDKERQGRLT